MLYIQKIKFKNLLSSGNTFTEIVFDETKTTLLRGANGNGKSLVITALIFGLYGKSNRGTTKKQLVNSINKKDCVVEVDFSSDGKLYKVVRGISPNCFEIWVNGKLQEELSAVKDQQSYLEKNILKISYKTFMQVVVLGSNNFTPFMQLSASERRDLVEELLDIKIFSMMNFILKDRLKAFERTLSETMNKKITVADKIEMQRRFIGTMENNGASTIQKKRLVIEERISENEKFENKIDELKKELVECEGNIDEIFKKSTSLSKLNTIGGKLEARASSVKDEISFFETNTSCPTCKSVLSDEFKYERMSHLNSVYSELVDGLESLNERIDTQKNIEAHLLKFRNNANQINFEISSLNSHIHMNKKIILETEREIFEIESNTKNQEYELKILKDLEKDERKLSKVEEQCKTALDYFRFACVLMKDDGIKSKIIEQYLPVINQQINKYLQLMDFYVNFNLNNEFKESVNTPIHEDFSYGSFSEGEKQKLNLAILFCWRDIAKMKNSVNCNLLFLDETFDSSLDSEGAECLLKIINYILKDLNVFVISHRIDDFTDKFQRVLEVKKINGFSRVYS